MTALTVQSLLKDLKDPIKEMALVRKGLKANIIEHVLVGLFKPIPQGEILARLHIPASTYFDKKKEKKPLDSYSTEKFIRLISIFKLATEILNEAEAKEWLCRSIPSLGNQAPLDLLDTEVGHRLVEQTLLRIKYGMYS